MVNGVVGGAECVEKGFSGCGGVEEGKGSEVSKVVTI